MDAKCCICLDLIEKDSIILTNPCAHWICANCVCKMLKIRKEGSTKKRCPMCRVLLVSNLFRKPCQYTMSKIIKSSIFAWVPTTEFIQENYDQMLIDSLMEGNSEIYCQACELLVQVCVRIVQSSDLEPSSKHQI